MSSVENSIITWLNSFEFVKPKITALQELSDGIVLFKILQEVSSQIWKDSGMNLTNPSNDLDRMKNVSCLFSGIQEFYRSKLLKDVLEDELDLENVCKHKNTNEIIKLCELTIGVVVQCDEKDEYINTIINLDEETQADLMKIIQKNLISNSQNNSSAGGDEESKSLNEHSLSDDNLNHSMSTINFETQFQLDKFRKQCQTLKMKLSDTEEENSRLKAQIAKLGIDLKEYQDKLDSERKRIKKDTSSNSRLDEVIEKLDTAERELHQKSYEWSTHLKKIQILEDKISDYRQQNSTDKEQYLDEIENLKSNLRKLEQVESINELYKRKLEETSDFKNKIRELEDQKESLISQIEDSEREIKMSKDYKNLYKNLQEELMEEREKSMKSMLEINDLKLKIEDKDSELKRLRSNLEFKDAQLRKKILEKQFKEESEDDSQIIESDLETLDKELGGAFDNDKASNEEIQKLKSENEKLKKQIRDSEDSMLKQLELDLQKKDSSLKLTQEDMERMKSRLNIFEKQNKELKEEIDKLKNNEYIHIELENEYKILKAENKSLKEKIQKLQAKAKGLEECRMELERLKKTHSDLEDEKKELKLEIKETRALLDKHKEENTHMKAKIIEKEGELKYSSLMKLELEALKNNTSQPVNPSFEHEKKVIEKENEVLRLQLTIKTMESDTKLLKEQYEKDKREMERNFQEERRNLLEEAERLSDDKQRVELDMKEQEQLMMSALASFYFDTLDKQNQEKQKEEKKGGKSSLLRNLRGNSYSLGGGF